MRVFIIGLLLAVAMACGVEPYDEQQHRADVEQASGPVADWPKLRDNMRALCAAPADMFAFAVTSNDAAGIDLDVHVRHLCPERLDEARSVRESR